LGKILSLIPLSSNPEIYTPVKLIQRDAELRQLEDVYSRVQRGNVPSVAAVSGPKSMGKTVTIRHFIKTVQARESKVSCLYVRCKSTFRETFKEIYPKVPREQTRVIDYVIKKQSLPLLVFLDDIHNVADRWLNLPIKHLYDSYKGEVLPIFMTNIPFRSLETRFAPEVLSRMSWSLGVFINFPSYSFNDIYQILKQRAEEALDPGSWEEKALEECARYGAQSRELRAAIDLLADACNFKPGEPLKLEHVNAALETAGIRTISHDLENLPLHSRLFLASLFIASHDQSTPKGVNLRDVETVYLKVCEKLSLTPKQYHALYRLRKDLETQDYVKTQTIPRTIIDSMGKKSRGSTTYLSLHLDTEVVHNALNQCEWSDLYEPEKLRMLLKYAIL